MDRVINFHFAFLLVGIFVFAAGAEEHRQIILGTLLSLIFCYSAYFAGALSLDGIAAATIAGIYTFGLGGIPATVVILLFFVSGSLLSSRGKTLEFRLFSRVRRNGLQVWANGFWFILFLACDTLFTNSLFLAAALGSVATAMADTWATELGSGRYNYKTYLLTSFNEVTPGTDGGVSLPGTAAAFAGSLLFSIVAVYVFSLNLALLLCILAGGFSGSLIDSYFGAAYQRRDVEITVPRAGDNGIYFDNNAVNFLSTGAGSFIVIMLKLLFV